MFEDTPEKKAWLANLAEARAFAEAHDDEVMSAANRDHYELMLRRTAQARSTLDVIEAATRVVARADGFGMSVTGRWLVVSGITLTYTGALWLVLYDVSGGALPITPLRHGNTVVGVILLVPGVAAWIVGAALRRAGRRRTQRWRVQAPDSGVLPR